jgi:hypothetical protein
MAGSECHGQSKMAELQLTIWLLDVHDGVVVLEHVDFINLRKWLDTYTRVKTPF